MNKTSAKDKIILSELKFSGCHGVYESEKTNPQGFTVSVTLYLDTRQAGESDDLRDTVNYVDCFEVIRRHAEDCSYNLIEALAENIARELLDFPEIGKVKVAVQKDTVTSGKYCFPALVSIEREI